MILSQTFPSPDIKTTDKEYICGYKHCLHHGVKVLSSNSVMVGKRHYHKDCAKHGEQLKACVDLYMTYKDDPTQKPFVTRVINTLVFKNRVPLDFIYKHIQKSKTFYINNSIYTLYGIKKLYWMRD